jgi:hypothetical protein
MDPLDAADDEELSDELLTDVNGGAVVGITIIP